MELKRMITKEIIWTILGFVLALIGGFLIIFWTSGRQPLIHPPQSKVAQATPEKVVQIIDEGPIVDNYGNGVYYFHRESNIEDFGNTLSAFIKKHPELELVSVTGAEIAGGTFGYFVVFRQKK